MLLSPVKLPQALLGALLAALAVHGVGSWWLMTHGWLGRSGGVLPNVASMAGVISQNGNAALRIQGQQVGENGRDPVVVRLRLAGVSSAPSPRAARPELSESGGAEPVDRFGAEIVHGKVASASQPIEPAAGDAPLFAHYLPTDALDHPPAPEPGWLIDESAFDGILRARLVLRLWVSSQGRIDRVVLVQAEPAGAWAEQAIRPLPGTRMLPGLIGGQPVSSVIVVEIAVDDEGFR